MCFGTITRAYFQFCTVYVRMINGKLYKKAWTRVVATRDAKRADYVEKDWRKRLYWKTIWFHTNKLSRYNHCSNCTDSTLFVLFYRPVSFTFSPRRCFRMKQWILCKVFFFFINWCTYKTRKVFSFCSSVKLRNVFVTFYVCCTYVKSCGLHLKIILKQVL